MEDPSPPASLDRPSVGLLVLEEPDAASSAPRRFALDQLVKRQISEATDRLASAEGELTLAVEAISVPEIGADNEMIGERVRSALHELGAARQALEAVLVESS